MRLAKYIAHTGYCSRRAADKLITDGAVIINGEQVTNFGTIINENDQVMINGSKLKLPKIGIWLYHKPARIITSRKDIKGRATVFQQLPDNLKNLISIGRLDFNTEGLLLMTNNGDLAKFMTDPKNNIPRKYKVRAFGKINKIKLEQVKQGITLNQINYKPIEIKIVSCTQNNSWFHLALTEGKNREIRNIFSFLELKIDRLIRVEYGIFQLKDLKVGETIEASKKKIDDYGL